MLHVTVIEGPDSVRSQVLTQDKVLIGRNSDCQVLLRNKHISSNHGELFLESERVYFRDLGSTNGSWLRRNRWLIAVDARRDFTVEVHDGDELLLGDATSPVRLRFCHLDVSLARVPSETELRSCRSEGGSEAERAPGLKANPRELAILHDFAARVQPDLGVQAICESLASSCLAMYRTASEVAVHICVGHSNELRMAVHRGRSRGQLQRLPEGVAVGALRKGAGSLIAQGGGICTPVMSGSQPIALLQVNGTEGLSVPFSDRDVEVLGELARQAAVPLATARMRFAFERSLGLLVRAAESRQPARAGRTASVTELARRLGNRLGIRGEELSRIERAATLHDIGMLAVPASILTKSGSLAPDEVEVVRSHVLTGANILKPIGLLEDLIPIVLHHHEHWDGTGYPRSLRGEEIPRASRILAVADAFQALVSARPHCPAVNEGEALEELRRCAGSQFDPTIVEAMTEVIDEGESWVDGAATEIAKDQPEPAPIRILTKV